MKTELLKKIEKALTPFGNYRCTETSERITIQTEDNLFTCTVVKRVIKICDEAHNKFNLFMENAKVKLEIYKHQ
jgi:hypothetical protein